MGTGPVTRSSSRRSSSWKLKAPDDRRTQGILVSGFAGLPSAQALFLRANAPGAAWINTLRTVAPITDATEDTQRRRAAVLAFTYSGLRQLGLRAEILNTFSQPFREGMFEEDRLRRLGDKIDGQWQSTVIDGGPTWSGNTQVDRMDTPDTVHALLLLYAKNEADARDWAADVQARLDPHGITVVRRLALDLQVDGNNIAREHFGFADGLSQPIPYGDSVVTGASRPSHKDPWHGVPLGEIMLGQRNAHHEIAPGPYVDGEQAGLPSQGAPEGFSSLGINGSYMVVRELRQNVAAFWNALKANAARIQAHDPAATHVTADWLAERVVGRTVDGHLLCPAGALAPHRDGQPQNDLGFMQADPHGYGCPVGSHVRRANPRDTLAADPASAQTVLDAANNHRILRRGRKYGSTPRSRYDDDGEDRGLLFICLNSDIARQFEFIQQTWILNRNFATLFDETDPLVGPKGPFTIPGKPFRRIVDVETFIQSAGGEYFFLPGIPALDYLAAL